MTTNRRTFLKLVSAGAAAPVIPAVAKAAEAAEQTTPLGVKTPSGLIIGKPLEKLPDMALSDTYSLGKSTFDRGTCMTASRWGVATVHVHGGKIQRLEPAPFDQAPSMQLESYGRQPYNGARIRYPMIRKSFLEKGYKAGGEGRGSEPFVRVSWEKAIEIVAGELKRVADTYGPGAIYGGSYGWFSCGLLGNARNLLWRTLNTCAGGYTGHYGDYSTGCAQVILPYVIGSNGVYEQVTSWELISDKTELVVLWGMDPTVTNDIDWCTTAHEDYSGYKMIRDKGIPCVAVNPLKPDTAEFIGDTCRWVAPRPGTDVAVMAAMCWELEKAGKADHAFIKKYTVGYDKFLDYLSGKADGVEKTAQWASKISDVPAETIVGLAHQMRDKRSMLMAGWGIQRAQYGEQVHWMMVTLAAVCGHIGLPGGGFGFTYHYSNGGAATSEAPSLRGISGVPKGVEVKKGLVRIPLARFTDCFLNPGKVIDYNGMKITYPDIKMVWWSGGNPFAQQEQLNRLVEAWKKPEVTIITDIVWNASARHADIVLPACTTLEKNDIINIGSYSNLGFVAMQKAIEPQYESLPDFEIYRRVCEKFGKADVFTEGKDEMGWIRSIYEAGSKASKANGLEMPSFEEFWKTGYVLFPVSEESERYNYFGDFRKNPVANPLGTQSGKIEIYSQKIASYKYEDCPPSPTWLEPKEWLGGEVAKEYPLALLTSKSRYRLHSQLDSTNSHDYADIDNREPVWIHPEEAKKHGIENGDLVLVESRYGSSICGAYVTDRVRKDVVVVHHGAWFCPKEGGKPGSLDLHGCDNVLTGDIPSSKLSCGNVANSWLVRISKFKGDADRVYVWEQPKSILA